ncbi:hypothetical protein AMST5_01870 [freshwater sediment metagenome]|uniref:Uncharacterized protein n=1 Tax=freshwater sediment metagenome TaxID=556182 RepID=A0AA48RAN6_9ZZZZ
MIALRARDNGQYLAAVLAPRSVRCTPDPQRALSFPTGSAARAFLREHGLADYFEPVARAGTAGVPLRTKDNRRRAV